MLAGTASVLYTFYPPLKASPSFYLGTALLIVGSWIGYIRWIPEYNRLAEGESGQKNAAGRGRDPGHIYHLVCLHAACRV